MYVAELTKQQQQEKIESLLKTSEETDKNIENDKKVARLKESAWISVYLPMFLDNTLVPDGLTLNKVWTNVSGSLMNEVIIVDDNDKEIITVPPLIATFSDFGSLDSVSLTELGESYVEATSKNKGHMVGDVPAGVMEAVLSECKVDETINDRWLALWDYYLVEGDEEEIDTTDEEEIIKPKGSDLEGF